MDKTFFMERRSARQGTSSFPMQVQDQQRVMQSGPLSPQGGYNVQVQGTANGYSDRMGNLPMNPSIQQSDLLKCEEQLKHADTFLQADLRRVDTNHLPWHLDEVGLCLTEVYDLLQKLFLDVTVLRDKRDPNAEYISNRVTQLDMELQTLLGYTEHLEKQAILIQQTSGDLKSSTNFDGHYAPGEPVVMRQVHSVQQQPMSKAQVQQVSSHGITNQQSFGSMGKYSTGFSTQSTGSRFERGDNREQHRKMRNLAHATLVRSTENLTTRSKVRVHSQTQVQSPTRSEMQSHFQESAWDAESQMRMLEGLLQGIEHNEDLLDSITWSSEIQTVAQQKENHQVAHRAILDLGRKIKDACHMESSVSPQMWGKYSNLLGDVNGKYKGLLSSSEERIQHLDEMYNFVLQASNSLMWLNQHEEEEVAYDWSDRNTDMARKTDEHSEFLRLLEEKENEINRIESTGESLLQNNHPGADTIEAFMQVLQLQWSWNVELVRCIESHLKENTAYFQFFKDAKDAEETLKTQSDGLRCTYTDTKSMSLPQLEKLYNNLMAERESLTQKNNLVSNLIARAKTVVQLKPRHPDERLQSALPIIALCNYKNNKVNISPGDRGLLKDNLRRIHWHITAPGGQNDDTLSVIFQIPGPNKDAMEIAHRIDQQNQNNLDVWQQLAINLKCMIYWKYLLRDMEVVLSWTIDQRLSSQEYSRLMNDLENNYEEFIRMSQDAQVLDSDEMVKLRQDYNTTVKHFENVSEAWEGQRVIPVGNTGSVSSSSGGGGPAPINDMPVKIQITPPLNSSPVDARCLNSMSVRLGDSEDRLLQLIQTQLRSGDPILESETRLEEVQVQCRELTDLKDQVEVLERDSVGLPQDSWRLLAKLSEKGRRLVDLSHTARDDLKIVDQLVSSVSESDNMLKSYEVRVAEENTAPSSLEGVHAHNMLLKQWRSELEQKDRLFRAMQDELVQATSVSERLNQQHNLHYPDVRPYGDRTHSLNERRKSLFTQINSRVKELGDLSRLLKPYRDSFQALDRWLTEATGRQRQIQDLYVKDSRTLSDQLNQQQILLHEVESHKSKVDQCREFSEKCSNIVQDYEKDLASYRLWVEKFHSTSIVPHKETSLSEIVTEEYMDIQQRYNALMAMTSKQLRHINDMSGKIGEEEFLRDVRKLEDLLNKQKDTMHCSYSCDRISKLPRIEAAVRDMPMVQKEILQYQKPVREVMSKASNIDQKMHADRLQQLYDNVLSLWKDQQADANSLQWWIRLQENINTVRAWTPTSFGKLSSDQQRETMRNLESNYEDLQKNMYGAKVLGIEDRAKSDTDVRFCRQHFRDLLTKMEKGKQEETMCQHYLDRLRAMEPQLDKYREQTLHHLHTPLTSTPSIDAQQRVMSQERIQRELVGLKETTEVMNQECGQLLCQLSESPLQTDLQTNLNAVTRRLDNLHGLSTGTVDDLKALEAMLQKFEEVDNMVKKYESRLVESSAIPGREDEAAMARRNLKQWQGDLYQCKTLQGTIDDAIQRACVASERLKRSHNENDVNVEAYQGKVKELGERRKRVQNNVDSRLGELEGLERCLQNCDKQHNGMSRWLGDAEVRYERLKSERLEDKQVVSQLQGQLKNLSSEIRLKQPQMDEMQKVSEACCSSIKDYEQLLKKFADEVSKQGLHTGTFARVPSQSPADDIRKETKELKNRYDALQGKAEQLNKSLLDAQQKLKDDEFMRMACELEKHLHDTEDTLNSRFSADSTTSSARLRSLLGELQNLQQKLVTYNVRIGQLGAKVKTAEHRNALHGLQQQYDKLAQQSEESTGFLQNLLALQDLESKTCIIRTWTLDTFKALPSGEAKRTVGEMDKSYRNLLEAAGPGGRGLSQTAKSQAESEVTFCQQHYRTLLNELDKVSQCHKLEQDCLTSLSSVRQRCDEFEDRISQKVHTLLGPSAVAENGQRIAQVQRIQKDIDEANDNYQQIKAKVTAALSFPKGSAIFEELQKTNYCLEHVHNMASLANQEMKLFTNLVEAFGAAEPPIRTLEARLVEAETCPDDTKAVEKYKATLKQWLAQAQQKREALSALDRQLREAHSVNDRLTEQFGPRDPNLESFRDGIESLQVCWRDAQTQVDFRLQDLDELSRRMQNVQTTQASLEPWLCQAIARQEKIELPRFKDSKGFAENVQAHKKLLDEVEKNGVKIDDCQKQSEDFSSAMKNYEVRLMTYRALVERHQTVPAKRGVRSPSDAIMQQYVDQRTRYNSLLTMMRHYLKLMNEQMSQSQENEFMREATEVEMHVRLMQDTIKSKYAVDNNTSMSRLEALSHDIKMDENKLPEYKRKIESLSSRAKSPAESSKVQSLSRIHSEILVLLNNSRTNLTAFLAWQKLCTEAHIISGWTTDTIRSKSSRDMEQALDGMDRQHAKFVQVSSCAPAMGAGERTVAEKEVSAAKKHYLSLKEKLGNESQQASLLSEWQVSVQSMRPRLENCNDRTSRILRQRFERDPPSENGSRIRQQLEVEAEAESFQTQIMQLKQGAAKLPLNVQTEHQTLCKCAEKMKAYAGLALEELQSIDPVVSGLVEAEKLVQDQELKLCSGKTVPCEVHELESYISDLKSSRVKLEGRAKVFMMLKEKLAILCTLNDRLMSSHGQTDVNLAFCQDKFETLHGRWDDATTQVETRMKLFTNLVEAFGAAEPPIRTLEARLVEAETCPDDTKAVEKYKATLKQWLAQAQRKCEALSALDWQLREAHSVNDRLTEQFGPRDPNLESFRDGIESLQVRWRDAQTQVDFRLQDLDELSRRMQNVQTTQASLEPWLCQAIARQEKIELPRFKDSKGFAENVQAHKKLLDEVEKNGVKIDDCQKQSEDFSSAVKNYEVRLMTYRALVERHQTVPAKRGVRSTSDAIMQQYVDQRTRYNSLLTMMRHYLKLMNEQMSQSQENEFMREATEVEMHVRLMQDTIKSKYAVDNNTSMSRLEALSHDIKMDENKVPEYKRKIESLSSRAKSPAESSKVQSLSRIHSEILVLLNNSRTNLTAFLAWQKLCTETHIISGWTTDTLRSKSSRDMEQALDGMDRQYAKFVQVSSCAPAMGAGERTVAEKEVSAAKKHYLSLKEKLGNESHRASLLSEWQVSVQSMRPRLENCNDRTSRILRQRFERDPLSENGSRIHQQLEVEAEAESFQTQIMQLKQGAAKLPLNVQTEHQTLCKCAEKMKAYAGLALEELQSIDPVVSGLVEAEKLVQDQELKLCSGKTVPCEVHELESYISDLKSSRVKLEGRAKVFMMLKEKLAILRTLNDRLMSSHGQTDVNLAFCQDKFDTLHGRWDDATTQVETRLQQLRMVLKQARNCSESLREMSQLTEISTSKFDQFNKAASETPEEIMDTLQRIEELRIEILNSKKRADHQRYTEELTAALKKLETFLITYRSRIEEYHISLPQQLVNGNEMYRKEIAELQQRLITLEASLTQAVTMLTDRRQRAERIRLHKITRHVRIIVDGEEMAMVDAFRSDLISEEKFIELANWQGEQTIMEEC